MYQGTSVASDADTISSLFDWFQFRELNYEDDKFLAMYRRNLDMFYPKYTLLLEDELTDIPELVNYKREITGQLRNYGSITDIIYNQLSGSNSDNYKDFKNDVDMYNTKTGSVDNNRTGKVENYNKHENNLHDRTVGEIHSEGYTDSPKEKNIVESDSNTHMSDVSRGMNRTLPQSTEYQPSAFTANDFGSKNAFDTEHSMGNLPNSLDWSTASNQAEDEAINRSKGHNETSTGAYTEYDDTKSFGEGNKQYGNDQTGYYEDAGHNEYKNVKDTTTYNSLEDRQHGYSKQTGTIEHSMGARTDGQNERRLDDKHDSFSTQKGFYGMTETEIREKIWDYITNSIALQWFIGKMERCFIGIFE